MTARGLYALLFGATLLLTALSIGSGGAFVMAVAALLAWLLAALSVLLARFSCRPAQQSDAFQAERGGSCRLVLSVSLFSPLPIAPLFLHVAMPNGRQSEFTLPAHLVGTTDSDIEFPCPHVGVFQMGLLSVTIGDVFGFFSLTRPSRLPPLLVTVLPVPMDIPVLPVHADTGEDACTRRAQADHSTPADIRVWQEGDDLKRVHWKLSMRRQTLMVHTYEAPQRPDALVLLDQSPPPAQGAKRAAMIDALTEACAGVLRGLLDAHRLTCLPLEGEQVRELRGQDAHRLPAMRQALAGADFSKPGSFARTLLSAARRMRRTGSVDILTAGLTPSVADAILALSRMGAGIRLILIAPTTLSEEQDQLLCLLETCGIETAHVRI